jgi:hypothetical protein
MNNRIKELAEKAGFVLWGDEKWGPGPDYIDWSSNYDKEFLKFAELIVRECLSYAKDGDIDFMKFMIKKNFGVEE